MAAEPSRRGPADLLPSLHEHGRHLCCPVREYVTTLAVYDGPRLVVEHELVEPGLGRRITLPEHRGEPRRRKDPPPPSPEEAAVRAAAPALDALARALRKRHGGRAMRPMRQLYRIYRDYPLPAIVAAVDHALAHGLTDIRRIEGMILRQIRREFFRLPPVPQEPDDDDPR